MLKNNSLVIFLIALVAGLVFIPFIGNCPLFDWDEINFAECAREMLVSGNYSQVQLHYRPFWEKPPFFIWLQAISMNIFGVNEFAARFPNAVCSIVSLITLYITGKNFHSQRFGLTWCLLFMASLLPHFYFKSGIIDPWFNLFIFLSIYNCFRLLNNPNGKKELLNALAGGFFLGMAVLTKGPAALLITFLTVLSFTIFTKQLSLLKSQKFIIFFLTTIFVSSSWFVTEWIKGNGHIVSEFIDYQFRLYNTEDSGHGGPFFYHVIVLLLGCFPASLLFIAAYRRKNELTPYQLQYRRIMLCLFWTVLIIFSVAKTKIVHYSSLCYYPLTFIASIGLVSAQPLTFKKVTRLLYFTVAVLIGIFFIAIGLTPFLKSLLINSGVIQDKFVIENLKANVNWSGFEFLIGIVFFLGALLLYSGIQQQKMSRVYLALTMNIFFIMLAISVIVPKIELYTQRAAIEFFRACAERDCHVETHGYKSYAHLFYSNRKPSDFNHPEQIAYVNEQLDQIELSGRSRLLSYSLSNMLWMEHGRINKPAFIVTKITSENELLANKKFKKLYEQNGYSFFVRMPD
jgi:4-amino-4-deoxy-L-arabinose transferase-like glycosyltransferase